MKMQHKLYELFHNGYRATSNNISEELLGSFDEKVYDKRLQYKLYMKDYLMQYFLREAANCLTKAFMLLK